MAATAPVPANKAKLMIVPNVVPRPPALRAVLFARYHGGGTNSSESDVQASGALYWPGIMRALAQRTR